MFLAIFLLDAAGKISKELISNIPIHLIDIMTIIAINTTNILSIIFVFILLLFANVEFMLTTFIKCKIPKYPYCYKC